MPLACKWPECGLQAALAGILLDRVLQLFARKSGSTLARPGETDSQTIRDAVAAGQLADVTVLLANRLLHRLHGVGRRCQPPGVLAVEHWQVVQLVAYVWGGLTAG